MAVIGSGTATSCQTDAASNAFTAAVEAGGVVTFDCGPDPVVMTVNTTVTGATTVVDGGGLVALWGENLRQLFIVTPGGDLTLRDIALVDGDSFGGAAVLVDAGARATVDKVIVTSNNAPSGSDGGRFPNNGTLTVTRSTIGSNSSGRNGGAIYSSGTLTVSRSILRGNQAVRGGAIYVATGTATVENSIFYDNLASAGGGAIYVNSGMLTLTNNTLMRNRADQAGAIWHFGGMAHLKNTIVGGSLNFAGLPGSLNCDGPA